jgi:adenine-specific DNA-methyltransferase
MTELIWEGKYDATGKQTKPVRLALPFQDVETVNESAETRNLMLDLWGRSEEREWRNRLIWGDKKYVLPSLLPEFAGKVNLIYIDPPFATGADFSYTASIPDDPDTEGDQSASFLKQPSMIEQKAYRDTWGRGLDGYLQWFYEAAVILHELLSEAGTLYVHVGPNISHYTKAVLDEVFGDANYVNEIIWRRAFGHSDSGRCGIIHDVLLLYGKTESRTWNKVLHAPNKEYIAQFFDQYDEVRGERYQRISLSAGGLSGGGYDYEYKGVRANWRCPLSTLERYDREGRLHWPKKGVPRLKRYESEYEGMALQDIWTDISKIHNQSPELLGYPTNPKPSSNASSKPRPTTAT